MNIFSAIDIPGDKFSVTQDPIKVEELLGESGYSIPPKGWEEELALPESYEVRRFTTCSPTLVSRQVCWKAVDEVLSQQPWFLGVGWRVVDYFYKNQQFLPFVWAEQLARGETITFPHAPCSYRKSSLEYCPGFTYDHSKKEIRCEVFSRSVALLAPMALYQK